MKILVNGCTGRMGKILCELLESGFGGHSFAGGFSRSSPVGGATRRYTSFEQFCGKADCMVDFSYHTLIEGLLRYCIERELPAVVATTGYTAEEYAQIEAAAQHIPIFYAANMSLGIALLAGLAKQTARMFPDADIEIVERHHSQKLDVPSGTALSLAAAIQEVREDAELVVGRCEGGRRRANEIGIHALRYGSEIGTHEVIVSTANETITLKHEAVNRALYAEGALAAASFLAGKRSGLYTMADMVSD